MKKEYSVPKAEKIEFNYQETIIASGTEGILKKKAHGGNGCWKGNMNGTTGCTPVYN